MKKAFLIFLILVSCSKSDGESEGQSSDDAQSLVGEWQEAEKINILLDGSKQNQNIDECQKKRKFRFYSNFKFEWEIWYEERESTCIHEATWTGDWSKHKSENGNYRFVYYDEFGIEQSVDYAKVSFASKQKLILEYIYYDPVGDRIGAIYIYNKIKDF